MLTWFDVSIYVMRYTNVKLANKVQKNSFYAFHRKSISETVANEAADIRLLKLPFQLMCSANSKSGQNN